MSNFFSNSNQQQKVLDSDLHITELEIKILESQNLIKNKNIWIYDVNLPKSQGLIHTIEAGRLNEKVLVLIHGYGSSAVYFFKVIAQLSRYFHIYAFDQFGVGLSSRPKVDLSEFETTSKFLTNAIEEWRLTLNIKDFIIAAHSFGGFTAIQYLRLHKPNIKSLILLSPAAFTNKPDEIRLKGVPFLSKMYLKFFNWVFKSSSEMQFSITWLTSLYGKEAFYDIYYSGEESLKGKVGQLFQEHYCKSYDLNTCTDKAIGTLMRNGKYSNRPCAPFIAEMQDQGYNVPITVVYGSKDWMDVEDSKKWIDDLGIDLDLKILEDATHNIYMSNLKGTCKIICENAGFEYNFK